MRRKFVTPSRASVVTLHPRDIASISSQQGNSFLRVPEGIVLENLEVLDALLPEIRIYKKSQWTTNEPPSKQHVPLNQEPRGQLELRHWHNAARTRLEHCYGKLVRFNTIYTTNIFYFLKESCPHLMTKQYKKHKMLLKQPYRFCRIVQ